MTEPDPNIYNNLVLNYVKTVMFNVTYKSLKGENQLIDDQNNAPL